MKEGWVCPKCGRIYGPMMMTCAYCNNKITIENENREKIKDVDARVEKLYKLGTQDWEDFNKAINSPK